MKRFISSNKVSEGFKSHKEPLTDGSHTERHMSFKDAQKRFSRKQLKPILQSSVNYIYFWDWKFGEVWYSSDNTNGLERVYTYGKDGLLFQAKTNTEGYTYESEIYNYNMPDWLRKLKQVNVDEIKFLIDMGLDRLDPKWSDYAELSGYYDMVHGIDRGFNESKLEDKHKRFQYVKDNYNEPTAYDLATELLQDGFSDDEDDIIEICGNYFPDEDVSSDVMEAVDDWNSH